VSLQVGENLGFAFGTDSPTNVAASRGHDARRSRSLPSPAVTTL